MSLKTLSLCSLFLVTPTAHAYITIRATSSGAEVHWPWGSRLVFRANTSNASGMRGGDLFTIFTTSLNRWVQVSRSSFNFQYFQGTDTGLYPNYLGANGDNSIFFTSNAGSGDQLQCGVIALTEVWFDPGNGQANKADLRFNDRCYTFTTNPADTVSQSRIYLGDVATHELGHALGLDHSENVQSSMIYTAAIEMSKPSCDDHAAMAHLYNAEGGAVGSLSGYVAGPSGQAVFGAHVEAIQLEKGIVMASALSDKDGTFHVRGLEPGHYAVMAEPYYPGPGPLSPYYSSINSNLCAGGMPFERTFLASGGKLVETPVGAGGDAGIGTLTVSCSMPSSLNNGEESAFRTAPLLAAATLATPVATQGVFENGNDQYFKLAAMQGQVSVHAMAYTLFSRSEVAVELLDTTGRAITQTDTPDVFTSAVSGYVNYDASATANLPAPQDIYVHVSLRSTLNDGVFPSGGIGVDNTPYYVVTASNGPGTTIYGINARCEEADAFGAYPNQGDAPPLPGPAGQDQGGGSSGGCGTLASGDDHDPFSGGGAQRLANFMILGAALFVARRRLAGSRAA